MNEHFLINDCGTCLATLKTLQIHNTSITPLANGTSTSSEVAKNEETLDPSKIRMLARLLTIYDFILDPFVCPAHVSRFAIQQPSGHVHYSISNPHMVTQRDPL